MFHHESLTHHEQNHTLAMLWTILAVIGILALAVWMYCNVNAN